MIKLKRLYTRNSKVFLSSIVPLSSFYMVLETKISPQDKTGKIGSVENHRVLKAKEWDVPTFDLKKLPPSLFQ